jgi:DNA-binding CsgD family transcriptional regulator
VKGRKIQPECRSQVLKSRLFPRAFVFFDDATGAKRFEIKACPDGSLPIEEAVSLLAVHCVVRGQKPADFRVMVSISDAVMESLAPRANRLIRDCMSTLLPMHLSPRQQEVLRCVTQNFSNKEIAAKLHLAERTVKFHVSALLRKFHVTGRVNLTRKAGELLSAARDPYVTPPLDIPIEAPRQPSLSAPALHPTLVRLSALERRAAR